MKPIYALHKDASGAILDAGAFEYSHKLGDWLRSLDVRSGDKIEFGEIASREDADIQPFAPPTFQPPPSPTPETDAALVDEQPF